ncbi:cytochrome C [Janthinobacterium sp.]|uniref:cytochrome C n=1 Tax=Janthinobacterium sp. TaxID=1871054 RepID=UPI00293D4BC6|nr:cytochrome C [Janthinobacterium sp.]
MPAFPTRLRAALSRALPACVLALAALLPLGAHALPAFARQTGQHCVACHAGGQFPELTPYGRLFKLTGYTLGERAAVPLAVMAVASYSKTRNTVSDTPSVDFAKDAALLFQTGSVFLAGEITERVGVFAQVTYDNYASQDPNTLDWAGHSHSDNIDLRYADRLSGPGRDLIYGFSLNNNPSVADVWNTVPAWQQYVPTNFGFTGAAAAPMMAQLGQQVAGVGAYAFWNGALYVEVAGYQAARGALSLLASGNDIGNRLRGVNPYARLALSREWGAHNAMLGVFAMNARVYPDPGNPSGPTTSYHDRGIDAQYQYLLEPHTATAQLSYVRERIGGADASGLADAAALDLAQFRAKASYIHGARYGAGLSYFRTSGSSDATLYPGLLDDGSGKLAPIPIGGSAANNPDTRGWTPELFWIPRQNVRVGLQYFMFERYNGRRSNYDGAGRNASDNNTLFAYVWAAY